MYPNKSSNKSSKTPASGRTRTRLVAFVCLATVATATIAAIVPHDQVRAYGASLGPVNGMFQPYLTVSSGCVPFPAVDSSGNVSGGLDNSGAVNGHCSSSGGQVYVRSANYGGKCAIMYAWYFPKDQNVNGPANKGHRHDWEDIVVWLNTCTTGGKIQQISYSQHGSYQKVAYNSPGGLKLSGTHPKVNYGQHGGILDHNVSPTDNQGGTQPGIAWQTMTQASRNTLSGYNFGAAVVPFKDSEFTKNLGKAN
jgi:hypothetical protein